MNKSTNICYKKEHKYNFDGYREISGSLKKPKALVASVFNDGSFYLNSQLFALFPSMDVHVKIRPDGLQLVIFGESSSEEKLHFKKGKKIKNYNLLKMLKQLNFQFPVYYVGEWDDKEKLWVGNFMKDNPNRKHNKVKNLDSNEIN